LPVTITRVLKSGSICVAGEPVAAFAAGTPSSIRPTPSLSADADEVLSVNAGLSVNNDTSPNVDGKRMERFLVNAQNYAAGTITSAP